MPDGGFPILFPGGIRMADKKEEKISKQAFKSFVKGAKFGSAFDPDLTEKKVEETRQFNTKEVFEHLSGKKKLPKEDVEALKRMAKHNRNL